MTTQDIIDYYKNLLIIQYYDKTKARATIDALCKEVVADQIYTQVLNAFDIDTAVGKQLDVLGQWVGIKSRNVISLLDPNKIYFTTPSYDDSKADTYQGFYEYAGTDIESLSFKPFSVFKKGNYIYTSDITDLFNCKIQKINLLTNTIVATIDVGRAANSFCFDGTYLWTTIANGYVKKIDIETNTVIATIAVGNTPQPICFDGTYIWVGNTGETTLNKIDPSSDTVIDTIPIGISPAGICFDGTYLWISGVGYIKKFDIGTNTTVATITVGSYPENILYDGTSIWVCNTGSTNIMKINPSTNAIVATINTTYYPGKMCLGDSYIWVTHEYEKIIRKIDISTNSIIENITLDNRPVAVYSDDIYLYSTTNVSNTLTKIGINSDAIAVNYFARYEDISVVQLDDTNLRKLIKLRIRKNISSNTLKEIDQIVYDFFGEDCEVIDNGDMSITYKFNSVNYEDFFWIAYWSDSLLRPSGVQLLVQGI